MSKRVDQEGKYYMGPHKSDELGYEPPFSDDAFNYYDYEALRLTTLRIRRHVNDSIL